MTVKGDPESAETYRGRNASWRCKEKRRLLRSLRTLLDANPGAAMTWEELEIKLSPLALETLRTLHYRVERALGETYENGVLVGQGRGEQ